MGTSLGASSRGRCTAHLRRSLAGCKLAHTCNSTAGSDQRTSCSSDEGERVSTAVHNPIRGHWFRGTILPASPTEARALLGESQHSISVFCSLLLPSSLSWRQGADHSSCVFLDDSCLVEAAAPLEQEMTAEENLT